MLSILVARVWTITHKQNTTRSSCMIETWAIHMHDRPTVSIKLMSLWIYIYIYIFRLTCKFLWSWDFYKQGWKEKEMLIAWWKGFLFAHNADDAVPYKNIMFRKISTWRPMRGLSRDIYSHTADQQIIRFYTRMSCPYLWNSPLTLSASVQSTSKFKSSLL